LEPSALSLDIDFFAFFLRLAQADSFLGHFLAFFGVFGHFVAFFDIFWHFLESV